MHFRWSAGRASKEPLGANEDGQRRITIRCTTQAPLPVLLNSVSKDVPELAPILENATHQSDLEIFVNRARLPAEAAPGFMARAGDEIELVVK